MNRDKIIEIMRALEGTDYRVFASVLNPVDEHGDTLFGRVAYSPLNNKALYNGEIFEVYGCDEYSLSIERK